MNIFKKAYNLLENQTPLDFDCGSLCEQACCKGNQNDGMLLFPGEEKLFDTYLDESFTITDSKINLSTGKVIKFLSCKGKCNRKIRPLACRIFPFTPYLTKENTLEIRIDLNSINTCPLVSNFEQYPIQEKFIDAIYAAFGELIDDSDILEFIDILSDDYDKTFQFYSNKK